MELKSNIQHLDNLSCVKELSDVEASQINGGNNNGLLQLAMESSEASGQTLQSAVSIAEELRGIDGSVDPARFAQLSVNLSTTHQEFKIQQERFSTIIKTIGEELASTSRKQ